MSPEVKGFNGDPEVLLRKMRTDRIRRTALDAGLYSSNARRMNREELIQWLLDSYLQDILNAAPKEDVP